MCIFHDHRDIDDDSAGDIDLVRAIPPHGRRSDQDRIYLTSEYDPYRGKDRTYVIRTTKVAGIGYPSYSIDPGGVHCEQCALEAQPHHEYHGSGHGCNSQHPLGPPSRPPYPPRYSSPSSYRTTQTNWPAPRHTSPPKYEYAHEPTRAYASWTDDFRSPLPDEKKKPDTDSKARPWYYDPMSPPLSDEEKKTRIIKPSMTLSRNAVGLNDSSRDARDRRRPGRLDDANQRQRRVHFDED